MTKQLFIPEKIKVGYQERSDTYTKRLAYVTYYDQKGKLRKEKSWKTWCTLEDQYHKPFDYDTRTYGEETLQKKGLGFDDLVSSKPSLFTKCVCWVTRQQYYTPTISY